MKWSMVLVVCLLACVNSVVLASVLFRVKPHSDVWEVDPSELSSLSVGSASDLSGREHFASIHPEEDNFEPDQEQDDGAPYREDDKQVGLCVEPRYCGSRDGAGLIEPRKSRCAKSKVFCPLDLLDEDYPTCGISIPNLIQDRIFSSASNSKSSLGEWPWLVMIMERRGIDKFYLCNGVLVDSLHVITVAHCFDKPEVNLNDIVIRLGEHNINSDNEPLSHLDVEGEIIVMHPNFTSSNLKNDIAMIRLAHRIHQDEHIGPICMPNPIEVRDFQTHDGSVQCITVGWGIASKGKKGSFSDVAKKVTLPLVDHDQCQHMLQKTKLGRKFELDSSFMCAGGEEGQDSCFGDGGSPLMCQQEDGTFALVGLVSWGIGCGEHNVPGVYTNVAEFLDFLDKCKAFMQATML